MQNDVTVPQCQWYIMRSFGIISGPFSSAEMLHLQYNNQLDGCLIRAVYDTEFSSLRDYCIAAGCTPFILGASALVEAINRKNGVPTATSVPSWGGMVSCQTAVPIQNPQIAANVMYAGQATSMMPYGCMTPSSMTFISGGEAETESSYGPCDVNHSKKPVTKETKECGTNTEFEYIEEPKEKKVTADADIQTFPIKVSSGSATRALSDLLGFTVVVVSPGCEK
ncbi:hypothetical protein QR680_013351 [Steinernema hermaphroditum]|uniref:Uncharacterized protein n=1 Tax=Steinernema hermaphroditum TaxID=289476 RepID=A0AA39I580_9BILA|nr:hypothetical protein QR680_013351 [Steinernema hermaphroditum]